MNNWISVKERLPENEQRILTCFFDKSVEFYQMDLLTYYKKGTVMDNRADRDPSHSAKEKLFNTLYNKDFEIVAQEDGFYIAEWDEEGDIAYRKHGDFITHWMLLPEGPDREEE